MANLTSKFTYTTRFFILTSLLLISGLFLYRSYIQKEGSELKQLNTQVINSVSSQNLMVNMPLRFIPNKGQAGLEAEYHVQAAGHTVLFHDEKIVLRREESIDKKNEIVLEFNGANKNPIIKGNEKLPSVANFFKGSDPSKWQTNLPTYSSIIYKELYPGIDMGYIGEEGKLESEFYVSAGADYNQINLNYKGIISKRIRDDGSLLLETELGELVEKAPYAYQDFDGVREEVEAEYTMLADAGIGFELGHYNEDFPVVIDPELVFLTVVPGPGGEWASGVIHDMDGNLILAGAGNRFFPATDVIDSSNHEGGSGNDGLLLKLDGTSGEVIYSALFGGSRSDYFNDIAMDESGNIFLVGMTASNNFPVVNGVQDTMGGKEDAFLSILNSNGELTYSTYLGGSMADWALDVALDDANNIFIAGRTISANFPVKNAFQDSIKGEEKYGEYPSDLFLAKFNFAGGLDFATYLGGSKNDRLSGIAINNLGELTITGSTESHDFPMQNAYQNSNTTIENWQSTMFISRLNSTGSGLIYSTYFGGTANDWSSGISIDISGNALISGGTTSEDFPIINGESFPEADSSDGVLIKLNEVGQPEYSLRTNISGNESFDAVAIASNIFPLAVGNWDDTIRIYQNNGDSVLSIVTDIAAPGHNINGVNISKGKLAFASTYWDPGFTNSKKNVFGKTLSSLSISRAGSGMKHVESSATTYWQLLNFDELSIGYDFGDGKLKIQTTPNGKVKVNNGETNINADEVKEIAIDTTPENDEIDLEAMLPEEFTSVTSIIVNTGDGLDKIWLHMLPTVKYLLDAGAGADQIYMALLFNIVEVIFSGGIGGDIYNLTRENSSGNSSKSALPRLNSTENAANAITFNDPEGYDTLNFAGYDIGITLKLNSQNLAQTIDTSGIQILLDGDFEVAIGTDFNDEITVSPLPDTVLFIDGNGGTNVLNFQAEVPGSVDDGSTITTPGFADVTYTNIETVNLSVVTGTEEAVDESLPISFGLSNNYPNPFNPSTKIKYQIPLNVNGETADVELIVFDILGREVSTLVNEQQKAGYYEIDFNATNLTSGIYFYRIHAGKFIETKKMIFMK